MAANPQSTQDWLKAFYAAADALDARGEVEAFFAQRFSELKSMRHAITTIDVLPDKVYHGAVVTYIIKDDDKEEEEISLRALTVFGKGWRGQNLLQSFVHGSDSSGGAKETDCPAQADTDMCSLGRLKPHSHVP
ncbi:hypothetical protein T310_1111 [Rasamsonia emersonii CBS 393.64]|uniref:PH domain-containing protein n=1 Tax=Rasamsonia emersonii (strain ATCC 16479 / CBS 393.64 / IMI 116815) TaxID=1408163 RepID=A0A0F4Z4P5_RASE3|nr:hypothetical protein T310_1111 [Rasamsonia emersonii CBS 393.64]KKA24843.1 hypothetical protein T310_1111 [Rasamsonia emersonii CBS 393.64]